MPKAITILPELQSLIPRLTPEELAQLEANLVAEGCRDPLVLWQETQTLLDGHNRLDICERHALTYAVYEVSLPDLDAAKIWIIRNQRGRRNLTPEQSSYLRGTEYLLTKGRHGGDRKSRGNFYPLIDTASHLAAEHKVSERTIKNDAAFSTAIDTLAAAVGGEDADTTRQALLARETHVDRQGVRTLAQIATHTNPQTAKHILEAMSAAPTPKAAKEVLRAAVKNDRELFARYGTSEDEEPRDDPPAPSVPASNGTVSTDSLAPPLFTEVEEPEAPEADESPTPPLLTLDDEPAPDEAPTGLPREGEGDMARERYTSKEWIDRVREVLGAIALDPASCAAANMVVRARAFYTIYTDGLSHPWHGTVYLNPPSTMPEVARFVGKLLAELAAGHVTAAVALVSNATEEAWFQAAARRAGAICFPAGDDAAGPCAGQALLYFGPNTGRFIEVFGELGLLVLVLGGTSGDRQRDRVLQEFKERVNANLAKMFQPPARRRPVPQKRAQAATATEPTPAAPGTIAEQIVQALRGAPQGMDNTALRHATGIDDRRRTHQAAERLVEQGALRKKGKTYHLATEKEMA
jgi:hypothetical protein